jgi:putative endopeptidase
LAVLPLLTLLLAGQNDLAGYSELFLERSQDPCTDFYAYACGGWMKTHPIPADRSAWDRYYQLEEASHAAIRQILEEEAAKKSSKIGAYYAACMDDEARERRKSLQVELELIAQVKDPKSLARAVARLQSFGAQGLFNFYSRQDWQNPEEVIAYVDQGGVAMSNPSDYLDADARALEKQARYREHVATMLGDPDDAQRAWRIEVALSKGAMSRKERRDPKNRNHKLARTALEALAPSFAWSAYWKATGAPAFTELNVANPKFFENLEPVLRTEEYVAWRAYLRWALLDAAAAVLPKKQDEADFDFYQRYQKGCPSRRLAGNDARAS